MPLYTFECESCELQFDDSRAVDDRSPSACRCGGQAVRLISTPSHVICKGGDGEGETRDILSSKAALARELFGVKPSAQREAAKMKAYGEQIAEAKQNVAAAKSAGARRPWKHALRIPAETFYHQRHADGKGAVSGEAGLEYWQQKGFGVEE